MSQPTPSTLEPSPIDSHLKGLDYSVVQQCMHCGLCLPSCPTYELTQMEKHSPRGRIALMRAIADDELEVSRSFAEEMYYCLGCLACMTACPAGVNYAELFEHARAEVESKNILQSPKRSLIRRLTISWLFTEQRRLQFLGTVMRLYQQSGLQTFIRSTGILKLMPKRLRDMEKMTPTICPRFTHELVDTITHPVGEKKISSRFTFRMCAGSNFQRCQSGHSGGSWPETDAK